MASFIFLILGFILLIKGADFLVDGACSLAKRLAVSDLVIGLTVVAFGTSTPELFVNVLAGIKGSAGIAIGNIIGSNICNILLILGVASIIFPLAVTKGTIRREIPICFLAVVVMAVITNDPMIDKGQNAVITRVDGLILLSFFIVFMYYTVISAQKDAVKADEVFEKHSSFWKSIFLVIIGLIALTVGSNC
ncbi:MAG: hypothetical protein KKD07_04165 [Candidatus Omnitrophica bacterium]|nr:hypothetical protein [Candidatus Omnitrophota bacterium]